MNVSKRKVFTEVRMTSTPSFLGLLCYNFESAYKKQNTQALHLKGANETFSIQTTYLPFFVIRARNWEKRFTTELRFLMRSFVKLLRFVFVTLFRSGRTVRTTSSQTSWLRGLKCNWHLSRVWTKSSCFLWSQAVRIENLICQQPPHCGLGYTLEHHAKDQAI